MSSDAVPGLVSILVPARDAGQWIAETLESALAQAWQRKEVLVLDDGSRDGTLEEARRFEGRGVRVLRQERAGPGAARNRLLLESRGEFLQFLDADDLLSREKISLQMERLRESPGCIASGEWARFHGRPEEARFAPGPADADLSPVEWLVRAFVGGEPMMQVGTYLFPREVLHRSGPWNEGLSLIEDFDFVTRALLASRGVRFCPGARLYYRSGIPGSVSGRRTPEAWRSALESVLSGTGALLRAEDSQRARGACADVFQALAYSCYPDAPAVSREAEGRAEALGGSRVRLQGGVLLRSAAAVAGWKAALRLKALACSLGYDRFARWKEGRRRPPAAASSA